MNIKLLLSVVAISLFLVACNQEKEIKVGISMPTLQEERWRKDQEIFTAELIRLGIKEENILVQSADGDEQKQVNQSENLITQGVDALIIIPQNGDAIGPVVKSAHEAGIKVVAVDRIINNVDLDFYVTFDAYTIGAIQAEYITNLKDSGNWILIEGAPTDPNAALIRQGQLSIIQPLIDSGNINIVLDQAANYWNPEEALRYTETGLTRADNDIQVVLASNDGTGGAAIEALEEQGLAGEVLVSGLDAELSAVQRIVKGTQSMTVYRRLAMQDKIAAQVAYAFATDQNIEDFMELPIETKNNKFKDVPAVLLKDSEVMFAVDGNNVEEVVKDGWLKADDIFKDIDPSLYPDWYLGN